MTALATEIREYIEVLRRQFGGHDVPAQAVAEHLESLLEVDPEAALVADDPTGDLITLTEVSRLFGVSRQRALQLAMTVTFPDCLSYVGNVRVWRRSEVEKWAKTRGRQLHEVS